MKTKFKQSGYYLRRNSKEVVMDYLKSREECAAQGSGIKLAEIFRACGFDWGDYTNATSTDQQYWVNLGMIHSKCMFEVPHRHVVLSLPERMWKIFREDRQLLKVLMHSTQRALFMGY